MKKGELRLCTVLPLLKDGAGVIGNLPVQPRTVFVPDGTDPLYGLAQEFRVSNPPIVFDAFQADRSFRIVGYISTILL
ncbi:MAG: hypothetical protein QMD46_06010 [Methanomicrobiales archaeon]|nr:hypothetical protein [Methanomicrobiales archaeon]MDI6876178.1 hypothetical protein [Methanomicrobiales archaeon]